MTEATSSKTAVLRGRRVLVVEDEYMIAQDVAEMLSQAGAETLGPVPGVMDALRLVAAPDRIDAALLDVNLRGEVVWPLVDVLQAREIPVVLVTGYDAGSIPPGYAPLPRREKPMEQHHLVAVLTRVLPPGPAPEN